MPSKPQFPPSQFPPILRRVALWSTGMMVASALYTLAMTHLLHWPFPFGTVWIAGGLEFCDFHVFQARSFHFMTSAYWRDYNYPFTYPAPVAIIFGLFYKLPHPLKVYLVLLVVELIAWVAWLTRGLATRGINRPQAAAFALIILGTTWPVYYLLDTANIEGLMALILALGVLAVLTGRHWTGATLIAIAGSMKLYPLVLLGLLFSKRRYKEFAFALILTVALTLASLALLGPSIGVAQAHINAGFDFVKNLYVVRQESIQLNFSHALFSPLKFAVIVADRLRHHVGLAGRVPSEQAVVDTTLRLYVYATALIGVALYFLRIRKLPMLNQTLALTVCAVLLTPFSSDYTLTHLLIPFGLLCFYAVDLWQNRLEVPGLNTAFACLCIVFGFETFFTWKFAFSNTFRTLALIILLITALYRPFRWATLDNPTSEAA